MSGFTRVPPSQTIPRQTSKWRCGPVALPVIPIRPTCWPRPTLWPFPTVSEVWLRLLETYGL